MKKILVTCLTAILLGWTTISSYSQSSNSIEKPESSPEELTFSLEKINPVKNPAPARLNEISARAVRNFTREHRNVSNAEWSKLEEGFVVYFLADSIVTRIIYDKRGNDKFMIRHYFENKLPKEVRHRIKSTYYDFNIYHVQEVTWFDKDKLAYVVAYVVTMEDKTSKDKIYWKIIRVVDEGEMEVIKEYSEKINHED